MNGEICELCTRKVTSGTMYRMSDGGMICEDCRDEVRCAKPVEIEENEGVDNEQADG